MRERARVDRGQQNEPGGRAEAGQIGGGELFHLPEGMGRPERFIMKTTVQVCENCGGGTAHHSVPGEPCWCPTCLPKPEDQRCTEWEPVEKELVRRRARMKAAKMKDKPRAGSFRRQVYDTVGRSGEKGITLAQLIYYTGKKETTVGEALMALMEAGFLTRVGDREAWVLKDRHLHR